MNRRSVSGTLLILLCGWLAGNSEAANHYVRSGATGNGSDWANAYGSLPSTLVRGDTYFIADGAYPGGYTFDDVDVEETYIYLKKATASAHGTDTGWDNTYGDGVAAFSGTWTFKSGHWDIDGVTGGGPGTGVGQWPQSWNTGHGISQTVDVSGDNIALAETQGKTGFRFRHIKLVNQSPASGPSAGNVFRMEVGGATYASDVLVEYIYIPAFMGVVFHVKSGNDWTIQYSYFEGNGSGSDFNHRELWSGIDNDRFIWRWNYIMNINNSAIWAFVNEGDPSEDVEIYGNIVDYCGFGTTGSSPAYMIMLDAGVSSNWKVFNNTVVGWVNGCPGVIADGLFTFCNNVYANHVHTYGPVMQTSVSSHNTIYNFYRPEVGDVIGYWAPIMGSNLQTLTSDPFVNYATRDLRLNAPTQPGTSSNSPAGNATDMFGYLRGADGVWDRGALEYTGNADLPATPATLASVFAAAQGGDTILLASGDYGTFEGGVKSGRVTFRIQPGAAVILSADFNPAANLTFDGVPLAGLQVRGASRNLVFSNVLFTAQVTFRDATGPMNVLFDHCTWGAIDDVGYYEGRLSTVGSVTGPCGITVQNSKFGPGGNLDGIQTGANGLQILNNEFVGLRSGSSGIHTDAIQLYGSQNTVIRGNYIHDCDSGIMAPDGTDHAIIEHNVIDPGEYPYAIMIGSDLNSVIRHNTLPDGPAAWGMRKGIISIGAGSTGTVVQDNVLGEVSLQEGSSASVNCNLVANAAPIGAADLQGLPTYVGGANPTVYAGFVLAAGSLGKGTASDGADRGIAVGDNLFLITGPVPGATFPAPALITITATGNAGTVTNVEFFAGTTKLGEDQTAPYSFTWPNVPIGSYTFTARATDDHGLMKTSTPVAVTVTAPGSAPVLGNTSEGNTTDTITDGTGSWINACRFQASAPATLTGICAKVGAITGRYTCALYSDSFNLLRPAATLSNVAAGWQTFPLTAPLVVTNGSYYWLAIWSDDTNARVHADTGGLIRYGLYPFGTWPDPVSLPDSGGYNYCLYATGPAPGPFNQWKSNYSLAASADNSDDDHDGIPLLLEYTLGLNPLNADTNQPVSGSLQSNYLTLTYTKIKAATDISYAAEAAGSLITGSWSSAAGEVEQAWKVSDGLTVQTITARDKTAVSNATSRFLRLKVSSP
jgi:hypothetical protein